MSLTEDFDVYFDNEFSTTATILGETVNGILDEGYEEGFDAGGYAPEFHMATSAVPSGTADGTDIVFADGRTFKIRGELRRDVTTKVTVLQLEFQSAS